MPLARMKPRATTFRAADALAHQPDAIVHKTIQKSKFGSSTLFALADGESIPEHKALNDEVLFMIAGVAEVVLDDKSFRLTEGDAVYIRPKTLHAVTGVADAKIMLTIIRNIAVE